MTLEEALRREEDEGIDPKPDPDEGNIDWSRMQVTLPRPKKT